MPDCAMPVYVYAVLLASGYQCIRIGEVVLSVLWLCVVHLHAYFCGEDACVSLYQWRLYAAVKAQCTPLPCREGCSPRFANVFQRRDIGGTGTVGGGEDCHRCVHTLVIA